MVSAKSMKRLEARLSALSVEGSAPSAHTATDSHTGNAVAFKRDLSNTGFHSLPADLLYTIADEVLPDHVKRRVHGRKSDDEAIPLLKVSRINYEIGQRIMRTTRTFCAQVLERGTMTSQLEKDIRSFRYVDLGLWTEWDVPNRRDLAAIRGKLKRVVEWLNMMFRKGRRTNDLLEKLHITFLVQTTDFQAFLTNPALPFLHPHQTFRLPADEDDDEGHVAVAKVVLQQVWLSTMLTHAFNEELAHLSAEAKQNVEITTNLLHTLPQIEVTRIDERTIEWEAVEDKVSGRVKSEQPTTKGGKAKGDKAKRDPPVITIY